MRDGIRMGRAMFALEILESYDWSDGSSGRMALNELKEFIGGNGGDAPLRDTAPGGGNGGDVPLRDTAPDPATAKAAQRPVAAFKKPPTPEEEEKFATLVKLAKQANANTIPLILKLAGRNGMSKAAMERVMGLTANSLSLYNTRPSKTVDRAFAVHFGTVPPGDTAPGGAGGSMTHINISKPGTEQDIQEDGNVER